MKTTTRQRQKTKITTTKTTTTKTAKTKKSTMTMIRGKETMTKRRKEKMTQQRRKPVDPRPAILASENPTNFPASSPPQLPSIKLTTSRRRIL